MAESLDDGKYWLPPRFLADDDIFVEGQSNSGVLHGKDVKGGFWCDADGFSKPPFPLEFPYGFESCNWDLSSPVSTETESDEEDYLAGLSRQMARSTLEDRHDLPFSKEYAKGYFTTGSPQSTLSPVSARCGCRQGSGHGSPNGCCMVSSPPATWDLLYAAAGEVARMRRMNQEGYAGSFESNNKGGGGGGGVLGPPRKRSPVSTVLVKNPNLDAGLYPQQSLSYQKLQASQFQQLRQQQMMKQQQQVAGGVWGGGQNRAAAAGMYQKQQETQPVVHSRGGRNPARPLGLSASAWPPLQQAQRQQHQQQQQQQVGSGMRALFLGNPGSKRECAGTGVFLPRRVGTPTERSETRNKPGSTTVLLPARVVQALNLKLDGMGTAQPRFNGSFSSPDGALRSRNGNLYGHQKRNLRSQQGMSNEVRLPQEWTY